MDYTLHGEKQSWILSTKEISKKKEVLFPTRATPSRNELTESINSETTVVPGTGATQLQGLTI